MISEISIANKLKQISDPRSSQDIINSGILMGINIYNNSINLVLEYEDNKFLPKKDLEASIIKLVKEIYPESKIKKCAF